MKQKRPGDDVPSWVEESTGPTVSIVTPVFNESKNLASLHRQLVDVLNSLDGLSWEWLAVDDHSTDDSPEQLRHLAESDSRIRYLRLARNEGSHIAIGAGLLHARGRCAIVLASDLQDPPGEFRRMLRYWQEGNHIVWMVRKAIDAKAYMPGGPGRVWFWIARRLPRLSNMPSSGSDMFLVDRQVISALRRLSLKKVALPLLLRSLGFRQINLAYGKRQRQHGTSKWTFSQKILHIVNTVLYFTAFPSRLVTVLGLGASIAAFVYAVFLAVRELVTGRQLPGWTSLMVLCALGFSATLAVLGILGEYLWRIFEHSRNMPDYIVEETSEVEGTMARVSGTPEAIYPGTGPEAKDEE